MTYYAARAIGYLVGWALVLLVIAAGCSALANVGRIPAGHDPIPTLAPFPTLGPEPTYEPVPHVTDDPNATPAPPPSWDCGDADPDDPEVDPEHDCVPT